MMNEQERQDISALMDDEADGQALRRLLEADGADSESVGLWSRYNLVRSVLQGCQVKAGPALSRRVAAAIQNLDYTPAAADDSALKHSRHSRPRRLSLARLPRWQHNLARVAIAASVTAAVLITLQNTLLSPDLQSDPQPAVASQSASDTGSPGLADAGSPGLTDAGSDGASGTVAMPSGAASGLIDAAGADNDVAANVLTYLERVYGGTGREPAYPVSTEYLEQLQDSPLYRLVNEIRADAAPLNDDPLMESGEPAPRRD